MSNNKISIGSANNSTVVGGTFIGNITNNNGENNKVDNKSKEEDEDETNNIKLIEKIIDNKFSFIFILLIIFSILIVYKN